MKSQLGNNESSRRADPLTRRRAAAASPRLSEQALQYLPTGIVVCDVDHPEQPIVYVNDGFERLTGYSSDEVLGLNCRFLQGEDTDPVAIAEMRDAIRERRAATVVLRNYRKDGTAFWNEVRLSPLAEDKSSVSHYTAVQTDVTARVEAEQHLRDSDERFRLLLQTTAEAIYGIDTDGICTFCTATCAEVLGYDDTDDLVGRNMHELIHYRLANGTPHRAEDCLISRGLVDGVATHCDTEVFWRRDGSSFPVEYWSCPIRRDTQVVGSIVSFLDLTEKQATAQTMLERTRMLETVNQINIALAGELELGRLVQQVTDAGRMLTGAEYGAFFYGRPDSGDGGCTLYALSGAERKSFDHFPMPRSTELFAPTFAHRQPVRIDDVLHDERYAKNAPHRGIPEGHVPVRSYLAVPVVARSGEAIGALIYGHSEPGQFTESDEHLLEGIAAQAAVAVDNARLYEEAQREIAERRQVERALDEACRAADQANRSKTEFLANMSHEIRTPMTAMLGYADILAAHLQDPDNQECVEVIKRNGRFLLDIVDDILDLSRIEAGKLRIDPEVFRLDELIGDVRSLIEVRAVEKKLPLLIDYAGKIPSVIETDPTRLRQVLINLLSNAIKFTSEGVVRLVIEYLGDRDGQSLFRFDVIDTGIGVDDQRRNEIFQPFSQVDTSLTRQYEGTGLGLAISQRLAEMLGGQITVESEVGSGSTFSFHMTAKSVPGATLVEASQDVISSDPGRPLQPRPLSGNILVVDDRRDIRYLAQYFLEEAGARVMCAEHGRDALDMVRDQQRRGMEFDLILMDMQMPVLDGYSATRTLRQRGFSRPIIALTAGAMRQDRERSIAAGCDAHVAKPIDGVALVNLVAHYIEDADAGELQRRRDQIADSKTEDQVNQPRNSKRILVVDDSADAAEAMVKLLQIKGHEVRSATSGTAAIEVAEQFAPQIVILDLGLPDMDGFTIARKLRELPDLHDALFLALSGRTAEPQQLAAAGFHHHFLKPANLAEILGLIAGDIDGPGLGGRSR